LIGEKAESSYDIVICEGACSGKNYGCTAIGQESKNLDSVTVLRNSCKDGYAACANIGYWYGESIFIEDESCQGKSSCQSLGQNTPTKINIDSGSCIGDQPCRSAAMAASTVSINPGQCVGNYSPAAGQNVNLYDEPCYRCQQVNPGDAIINDTTCPAE
jgi:hypothetical protein